MIRSFAIAALLSITACGLAVAQAPSSANLLQNWVCPGGTCPTQCNGPAGAVTITAHDVKVFQFTVHPRRIWLDADGQIYVLGDDDRCHFGGATSTPIGFVSPPPEVDPIPPVNPGCTCIGNQCTPPGCKPK